MATCKAGKQSLTQLEIAHLRLSRWDGASVGLAPLQHRTCGGCRCDGKKETS